MPCHDRDCPHIPSVGGATAPPTLLHAVTSCPPVRKPNEAVARCTFRAWKRPGLPRSRSSPTLTPTTSPRSRPPRPRSVLRRTRTRDRSDFGYALYAIERGTAEVSADGTRLRTLGPGEVFGEIALLASGRRTATVTATSPMQLIAFFKRDVWALEERSPEVATRLRALIADWGAAAARESSRPAARRAHAGCSRARPTGAHPPA
jgi:CRP-like cAMP-binding protein